VLLKDEDARYAADGYDEVGKKLEFIANRSDMIATVLTSASRKQ